MRKTAVTTLLIRMFGEEWPNNKNFNDMVDEVLELEKKQHEDTWLTGGIEMLADDCIGRGKTFKEYFNQTYGAGDGVRKLDI
jgi:hypothetical protein